MENFQLDFVAVGPQRTGTTWLYSVLQNHPGICFPKNVKETMFFELYYDKGIEWYVSHFEHQKINQICGEIAPTYLDMDGIPERIYQLNSRCKIIINLRNPIKRALSLYRHHLSKGRVKGSFSDAVRQMPRILKSGQYAQHIPKWIDRFGTDQVRIYLLEDIETNPNNILQEICRFLDIHPISFSQDNSQKINSATLPKFPILAKIAARLVTQLREKRLHRVVEFGKKMGFNRVYTGSAKKLPTLTEPEHLELLKQYESDIHFVEKILKRDLLEWRQPYINKEQS